MPPFAGTDAFLAEQARVHRAAAADEAFRERYNLGDPIGTAARAHAFLMRQHMIEERARMIEEAKERERIRRERQRAEEGRQRLAMLEKQNQYREDLRREREKAAEGKMRFAQIAEANKHRADLARQEELAADGKRRFAQSEFLSDYQRREDDRRAAEREEQARAVFESTQRAPR